MQTKRCFQCSICLKRLSFKNSHPEHQQLERIFKRNDEKLYPIDVQLTLRTLREKLYKPFQDIVLEFDTHSQGLADDGDVVSVLTLSSKLRLFLGFVVYETKEFTETTALATSIRNFMTKQPETNHNFKLFIQTEEVFSKCGVAHSRQIPRIQMSSMG